jgi:asparagine synthase (glutamine-hydrolysing)
MCGITGFFNPNGFNRAESETTLIKMRDRLVHRGPDDSGIWVDEEVGVALAHRRLSILDLSVAGHQPMFSISGRYVMIFNGEIYNHLDIRKKLESIGHREWVGHSDTETLLMSFEQWGIDKTLKETVGMFAIAVWDRKERVITLSRDRVGEKPLYYGWQNGVLLFGSELKSLVVHPAFNRLIDHDVLPLYLRHGYIPAPWSIWKGIRKLLPGTWVKFSASTRAEMPEPTPYWSMQEAIEHGQANPFVGSDTEAIDTLEKLLSEAIAGQRMSDVPLGAFLSGGVDSSTVVALMQAQSNQRVKTFTIGFNESKYNEAVHAKAVADYLGTDHTELYVTSNQARDVIPQLAEMYDEPFGDSSAIPTHLVSQLARKHVTVSLSGDGGDELFGGYNRYYNRKANQIWKISQRLPSRTRELMVNTIRSVRMEQADRLMSRFGTPVRAKLSHIANLAESNNNEEVYRASISHWSKSTSKRHFVELDYGFSTSDLQLINDPLHRMMAFDSVTYLPDDILAKVDRAAMSVSLETRVPMLDHRLVEFAWSLPAHLIHRENEGKWILKQVLDRYVPRKLMQRPKMGFGVPIDHWIRGPLRDWAEGLLSQDRLELDGYLNTREIRLRFDEHMQNRFNWRDSLWQLLMWQSWLERCKQDAL